MSSTPTRPNALKDPARPDLGWWEFGVPGEWVADAACASVADWDDADPVDQREVCRRCPVLEQCAEWASGFTWCATTVAGWTAPPIHPRPMRRLARAGV